MARIRTSEVAKGKGKEKVAKVIMPTTHALFKSTQQEKKFFDDTCNRTVVEGTRVKFDDLVGMPVFTWLREVGLDKYCTTEDPIYVNLVRYFYNNWEEKRTANGVQCSTFVKGIKIPLNESVIKEALGFNEPADGEEDLYVRICNVGKYEEVGEWQYNKCFASFAANTKVGGLNPYIRILHKIVVECIVPRAGNGSTITCNDACIVWHILKKRRIDMPYLIFNSMRHIVGKGANKALPYGMVITKILHSYLVSFDGELTLPFNDVHNVINSRRMKLMHYHLDTDGNVWRTMTSPSVSLDSFPLKRGGRLPMNLDDPLTVNEDAQEIAPSAAIGSSQEVEEDECDSNGEEETYSDCGSYPMGELDTFFGEKRSATVKDLKLLDERIRHKIDKKFARLDNKFKKLEDFTKRKFGKIERMLTAILNNQ